MSAVVVLQIRNDKERGILVLTIRQADSDVVFFFKPHHQPLRQHPIQVQEIVKRSNPTARTKTLTLEFMGVVLSSTDDQSKKTYNRLLNKEVGAIKRKETIK